MPNYLQGDDKDHPIFGAQDLPTFIKLWERLKADYQPKESSKSFRILATIQSMGLARVACGCRDGQQGAIENVQKGKVQVSLDKSFGAYNPVPDQVTFLGVNQP